MPATAARPQPSSSSSSSTGRPSRRSKDRGARFIDKHALKYGLSICSRSATDNSVEMVMCKFCVAFGKESATDPTRKRRATANIKYFRQPFRADHYLSHLEINHKSKWAEYERASAHEKEQFFFSSGANGALHDALSLTNHEDVAVGAADVDRLLPASTNRCTISEHGANHRCRLPHRLSSGRFVCQFPRSNARWLRA
ncbi:hypothetical protein PINS_up010046 [Pythium insidiosum]|nr:hypothetical protein PINS_up010046 [Pythium insidiosum]